MKKQRFIPACVTFLGGLLATTSISHAAEKDVDLLNMSLSQLSNVSVTSVSKKSEKASQAPAAIYVITQEDIHRSGATSIPEALRMVPGIQVAQAGSNQWAITSRGHNDQFANKLLVLMDGRTLYTPLFSGVYWDVQDTMLEDIERIEVIRGPGATLWGANAVNGVINIITKKAADSSGGIVNAGYGNHERGFVSGRYGGSLNEKTHYRGYAKFMRKDELEAVTGGDANDAWRQGRGGFRVDYEHSDRDDFTFQGDIYRGSSDFPITTPSLAFPFAQSISDQEDVSGANILTRWNRKLSENGNMSLQVYYDNASRSNAVLENSVHTFDVDFQHAFTPHQRHELVWGGGYRLVKDSIEDTIIVNFNPDNTNDNTFSAFVQDKVALSADELYLTLGSKFEHNDYTGFEYQPSAKLTWLLNDKQTLWTSVSRAVRTPNRGNSDAILSVLTVPTGNPLLPAGFVSSVGNTELDSEELIAYEIGYKIQPKENLSIDISAFYNDYDKEFAGALGAPFLNVYNGLPYVIVPIGTENLGEPDSQGVELAVNWKVMDNWQLAAGYNYLNFDFNAVGAGFSFGGKSPRHQFNAMLITTVILQHSAAMPLMLLEAFQVKG